MIPLLALVLAASPAASTPHAQVPSMTRAEWEAYAEKEEAALEAIARSEDARGAWGRLRSLYRRCPVCMSGSASEVPGWAAARLLANHRDLFGELANLAAEDPEWLRFLLGRLHGPIDPKLLRRAAANMDECPAAHRDLCGQIRREASKAAAEIEGVDPDAAASTSPR